MTKYKLSRFKDRDTRKVFGTILGGKMLGILGALALMQAFIWLFGNVAEAAGLQEAATVSDDLVNPINTMWTLVAAFLVFFMQAGFMALEAGFARSRESANIMMECIGSVTSPAPPWSTRSAGSSPWPAPSSSAPASGGSSPRTAVARRLPTT